MVGPSQGVLSDAELLGRFVDHRDEAAFEALVWRHGSTVLGTCRRVLRNEQDAEDAFQAAFLALARKASTVRRRGALGPWLYRVALRVALRAREHASADKTRALLPEALLTPSRPDEAEQRELRHILEEEIQRLPAKYRSVVVLRYLEGRSTAETATALDCPAGTVLSRLSWARRRLQMQLAARGAALPAAFAATAVTGGAMGAPPFRWVAAAVRGATAFASSGTSGVGPTRSALLAEGVLRAMMMTKVKVAAFLILGALAGGTILQSPLLRAARQATQEESATSEPPPTQVKTPPTSRPVAVQTPPKEEPPEVTIMRPIKREVVQYLDFTGSTEASAAVEIRPRFSGILNKVFVQPETKVKRGDILFELDSLALQIKELRATDRVRLAEADFNEANRFLERAKLAQKLDLEKVGPENAVNRREREESVDQSERNVAKLKTGFKVAQVEWEQAKSELNAARIAAPMDGHVGRILVSEGSSVSPTTGLTILISSDPIKVAFLMDELSFRKLQKQLPGAGAGPKMTVLMGLAGENDFPRRGQVESVDNRFDAGSGTIRTWAVFPNPQKEILPGMNARIRLLTGEPTERLLVPEQSIRTVNGIKLVWLVNEKNALDTREVTLGLSHDGLRVIEKGLNATDRVVTGSFESLVYGEVVKPREVPVDAKDSKAKAGSASPASKND
jgi:multidrug efflux system membrane fusion protein